ncbi:MAG: UDP-N-acetylmuramoyl-L-alanyl-D-glutamate--2,6-diaminopimelate ligase [Nitrospirae bacterium]|nr:UDP-N-acetylmuramoyl-L-alanyl-D-glutamate--2,6-diaminopimelate ligase [Nitrospirota bacterium]MCL5978983.1 UDP-N-acetylmuramoyl-L-alanyl-D-glutamate--2,6-diaminopimelate ligase [Nitrospirota bacterium]
MKIKDILTDGFNVNGDIEKNISGIAYDSRSVKGGDLFVAVKGENFDGHAFIEDAIKKGAKAVIYERKAIGDRQEAIKKYPDVVWIGVEDGRDALAAVSHNFYGRPSQALTVVGITGTNGKTTTSYLIKSILEKWGKDTGLIGTISYLIKDSAYEARHTTPEAPDFQSLLKEMADKVCSHVITEVSSHALSQKRVDHTRFKVAVFTNLTRDHLDFHHTMEDYCAAKVRLFAELLTEDSIAVVNADDAYGRKMTDDLRAQWSRVKDQGKRILTYAIDDQNADIVAYDIKTTFKGTSFKVRIKGKEDIDVISPLVGITNVYNMLSSIGAALSMDVPIKSIKEGIAMTGLIKGRFEKVDMGQDFLAVVDYAHTEDALERLLVTARQLMEAYRFTQETEKMMKAKRRQYAITEKKAEKSGSGKIITVFGCGGNRDKGKRSKMGEIAAKMSDFVIITSDNPRGESPRAIIRDIEKGISGDNYIVIQDRNVAIGMAVELASSGDIVLVAGKGHEDYQEIEGKRYSFSDRTALESAIRRAIGRPSFGGGTNYRGTDTVRC